MKTSLNPCVCLLPLLAASCVVVPLGNKVTAGHKPSAAALDFLDLPGTKRDEVVATLGSPYFESAETRTLVYLWEQTSRTLVAVPDGFVPLNPWSKAPIPVPGYLGPTPVDLRGSPDLWGLFIAFDEQALVAAHEIRRIQSPTLEQACIDWNGTRKKAP